MLITKISYKSSIQGGLTGFSPMLQSMHECTFDQNNVLILEYM